MRVAIDATPLTVHAGGVRRYTEELTRALRAAFPSDEFALLSDQHAGPDPVPAGPLARRWWTLGVQREMARLGTEVFHGSDFAVPYLPVRPSVITIHDLSPWRRDLPGNYSPRVRRRTPWLLRLGIATMAITPTRAIKSELIAMFQTPEERVAVVAEGASLPAADAMRRPAPYFLAVGSGQPRKNIARVVDAWRPLRGRADLVVVGPLPAGQSPEPGVEWLNCVPDRDLARWYAGAAALVYPSLYEGFGLPVVEAMAAGTPVVASRDPALLEVAGGAALHVDATDVAALSAAMASMLDPARAREHSDLGRRRSEHFTWARAARETREVYAEAIRRFGG